MDRLITLIENIVNDLFKANMEGYAHDAQMLMDALMVEVPVVISYYYNVEMSDLAEDALYWPGQVERIIGALESGDDFATIDVLYNETRANLIELRRILLSRGLI